MRTALKIITNVLQGKSRGYCAGVAIGFLMWGYCVLVAGAGHIQIMPSVMAINGVQIAASEKKTTLLEKLHRSFTVRDVTFQTDASLARGQSSFLIWVRQIADTGGFPPEKPIAQAEFIGERLTAFTAYRYPARKEDFSRIIAEALGSISNPNLTCAVSVKDSSESQKHTLIKCEKRELLIFPDVVMEIMRP